MKSFPAEFERDDMNPSIRLFGRRFSNDLQTMNVLAELLLVVSASKRIGEVSTAFVTFFPGESELAALRNGRSSVSYSPKARLNLKLFSFFNASSLSTRHPVHREHAKELWHGLSRKISIDSEKDRQSILQTVSALCLGFLGNGAGRTWCAQTFLPFSQSLLCSETIWNKKNSRQIDSRVWLEVLNNVSKFFSFTKHEIYDRSGESLYLHLCSAFARTANEVDEWLSSRVDLKESLLPEERDPTALCRSLSNALSDFFNATPRGLTSLLDFIDTSVEVDTSKATDWEDGRNVPRFTECGWAPDDCWREGYLFAVELRRLLSANIDVMDKIEMLEIACALQILRILATQTYRQSSAPGGTGDGSDFRLLLCDVGDRSRKQKSYSEQSLVELSREMKLTIRKPELQEGIPEADRDKVNKEGDAYGYKLYRKLGKAIGIIVPPTGGRMKATLNDKVLRCLVLTLVPGKRMTLDSFKQRLKAHHGFVFHPYELIDSRNWSGRKQELVGERGGDAWLERMLDASGMFVRLSDACSLVCNQFVRT